MWLTNLKIVLLVLGTLAIYTLVASAIPQVESDVPEELSFSGEVSTAELVAAGETLYEGAGNCVSCHGLGTRAPNLLSDHAGEGPVGARCDERVEGQDCKTYLYESMVQPGEYIVEGFNNIMLDQTRTLSNNQIWALVAYLQDQGGEVTVSSADIQATAEEGAAAEAPGAGAGPAMAQGSEPMELLENNMCLNCHTLGDQGVELGPSFTDIGARVDREYIRTSILAPNADAAEGYENLKGAMPTNYGQMFTAEQLEAIVDFLARQGGGGS